MTTKKITPENMEIVSVITTEDTSTANIYQGAAKINTNTLSKGTKTNDEVFTVSEGKTPEEGKLEVSYDSDELNIEETILKTIEGGTKIVLKNNKYSIAERE